MLSHNKPHIIPGDITAKTLKTSWIAQGQQVEVLENTFVNLFKVENLVGSQVVLSAFF